MRVEFLKVARHFASLVTVIIFTQCSRILSSSSYLEAKSLEFGYFLASKSGSWLMRRLISSLALFFRDCWTLGWLEASFITSLTEVKGWIPVALMASDITSEMTSPTAPEGLCLDDNRRRLADWVVKYASLNGLWGSWLFWRVTSRLTIGTQLDGKVPCQGWLPMAIVESTSLGANNYIKCNLRHFASLVTVIIFTQCSRILSSYV